MDVQELARKLGTVEGLLNTFFNPKFLRELEVDTQVKMVQPFYTFSWKQTIFDSLTIVETSEFCVCSRSLGYWNRS